MATYHIRVFWIAMLLVALTSTPAGAGPPTDQFRDGVDRVFKILRDPELKGDAQAGRRIAAVAQVADEMFDFAETAKRSLGRHWEARTPAEREEFVRLFTALVQRSYISRVDQYGSEKMIFRGDTIDGDQAIVRTALVLREGGQMPLDYRMHNVSDRWKVYDLSVDGISLVANYRAQFNKVIRSASYETLIERLKSHNAEFAAAPAVRKLSQ
ncbi:MAG TPA: ABC transporter substrate-binding protein [Methylomirabilota bacterium]|jgi:phospholipid transport system substrate-binding protein